MVRVVSGVERDGATAGRRRRSYTVAQKRELVAATMQPGVSVSAVAQRHGINANLLFTWRRQVREGRLEVSGAAPVEPAQFIALGVVGSDAGVRGSADVLSRATAPVVAGSASRLERPKLCDSHCRIEIELPNGVRLRVEDAVEAAALRQVIAALKEAW
jgi:transposase